MTDPTPVTHTLAVKRKTLQEVLDFVAFLCGLKESDFATGSDERNILIDLINDEVEEWRILTPIKGIGEIEFDYEWAGGGGEDPATGDTKIRLPIDWAETVSGGTFWEIDKDGNRADTVHLISYEMFHQNFVQSQSAFDNIRTHVAIIHRVDSTDYRRICELYPAPSDGYKLRVPYKGQLERLVAVTDKLEAPTSIHRGIMYGSAVAFLMTGRGASEKLDDYRSEKTRITALWRSPEAREIKRVRRIRSFTEHGYAAFEPPVADRYPVLRQNRTTT